VDTHYNLKNDLVEHLWAWKGNNENWNKKFGMFKILVNTCLLVLSICPLIAYQSLINSFFKGNQITFPKTYRRWILWWILWLKVLSLQLSWWTIKC
jgi:hypothetical protein